MERTVYAREYRGAITATSIGTHPSEKDHKQALSYNRFSRGNSYIHVVVLEGRVSLEQQRKLAIAAYEGRMTRYDFNTL